MEKTLTFTVEDALLSPISFAILSGAGVIHNSNEDTPNGVHVHTTSYATVSKSANDLVIDLTDALGTEEIDETAPIFVTAVESDGSIKSLVTDIFEVTTGKKQVLKDTTEVGSRTLKEADKVFVDFYVIKDKDEAVTELQIDASSFSGNFYVEASTLFRKEETGKDMPAEITLPNVKIQSNFTFSMASSGDPSTFTFTMDALPGYTFFDNTKKVTCVIQIIDSTIKEAKAHSVMRHETAEEYTIEDGKDVDSVPKKN